MNFSPFNNDIASYFVDGLLNEQLSAKPELSNNIAERENNAARFADELMNILVTHQSDTNAKNTLIEQSQNLIQNTVLGFFSSKGFVQESIPQSDIQANFLQRLHSNLQSSDQVSGSNIKKENVAMVADSGILPVDDAKASISDNLVSALFGGNGIDLTDGFDAVNVLHHIPLVSTVYQNISDSDISTASKLAGGLLYGGPTGLAFSALDLAIENISGVSIGENIMDFNYDEAWQSLARGLSELVRTNSTQMDTRKNTASVDQMFATTAFSLAKQLSR